MTPDAPARPAAFQSRSHCPALFLRSRRPGRRGAAGDISLRSSRYESIGRVLVPIASSSGNKRRDQQAQPNHPVCPSRAPLHPSAKERAPRTETRVARRSPPPRAPRLREKDAPPRTDSLTPNCLEATRLPLHMAPKPKWWNWQTRQIQGLVRATAWRFESSLRHQRRRHCPIPERASAGPVDKGAPLTRGFFVSGARDLRASLQTGRESRYKSKA